MTPTEDAAEAEVVVFNTCAIRENADNRLYGNLGHLRPLKAARTRELRIVVAGCLAQKDQGEIQRARPVGRRRHRDPCAAAAPGAARPSRARRPADGRARVHRDLSFAPSRRRGTTTLQAWVSIAPGCDNALHVLHRPARARAPAVALDRRHPRRGAGAGARAAWSRSRCSARTSTRSAATSRSRDRARRPLFARASARGRRRRGHPARAVHQPAPARLHARRDRGDGRVASRVRAHPLPAAVRVGPGAAGDAPLVPARSATSAGSIGSARRSPGSRSRPTSSSGSPARPRRTSRRRSTSSSAPGSTPPTRSSTRRAPAPRRPRSTTRSRRRSCRSASTGSSPCRSRSRSSVHREQVGRVGRGPGRGAGSKGGVDAGADAHEPDRARRRSRSRPATFASARITAAAAHHLPASSSRPPAGRRPG